jgi:dTMP kinase
MTRGRFITFEGLDGAGKSTHIAATAERLRARGVEVIVTREPGGTPLGERLRELVLSEAMHLETETLLMFAARREHIARVIEPAILRGAWVVCDRFTDATRAYQGGGRGVDAGKIEALANWVHPDLRPDLTFLFDLPPEVARARISGQRTLDRFELEKADFHLRVRQRYLEFAHAEPERFRIVNAASSEAEIDVILEKELSTI